MSDPNTSAKFLEDLAEGRISGPEAERKLAECTDLQGVAKDLAALQSRLDELGTEGLIEAARENIDAADLASSQAFFGTRLEMAARRRRRNQFLALAAALVVLLGIGWRFVQDDPGTLDRDRFLGGPEATAEQVTLRAGEPLDYDLEFGAFDRARLEFFSADGTELPVDPLVVEAWPWAPGAETLDQLPPEGLLRISHERSGERLFRFSGEYPFEVSSQ